MTRAYLTLMGSVLLAPLVFYTYLMNGLVCAPRSIAASLIFGAVPLALATAGVLTRRRIYPLAALVVLGIEVIITPLIMVHRLGWEMFIGERLLAFFSFELIAIFQAWLVWLMMREQTGGTEISMDELEQPLTS